MRKTMFSLALAASALTAAACSAQTAPQAQPQPQPQPEMQQPDMPRAPRGGGMMMRADTNGDGIVTRQEVIAQADARFDRLDANRDGKITPDEMAAMRNRRANGEEGAAPPPPGGYRNAGGMGRRADPDGDGTITKAEFEARATARFDRMDANHDGKLDATEMANFADMRRLHRDERRGGGDTPPPPPAGE